MNTNEFIREEDGKIVIPVPAGIRYISEWTDFNLDFFGCQPYIIDKQIPGCGFTEYCLTSNENVILTSPRRILLENKEGQHPGDVFYAKNECDDSYTVDKDLSKPPPKIASLGFGILVEDKKEESDEDKDNHLELTRMEIELMSYLNDRALQRKPAKIIVTYDSFKHVKRFLIKNNFLSHFGIIVDEFQSIFVDSRFKASTEFGFLEELRDLNNPICFVSATPMMDKYLKQLDYFKDLQYFVLNWGIKEPSRVMKPELKVRKTKSINNEIKRIINEYRSGNFAILANPLTDNPVQSKEAVFYVNSVNNILSVIKAEGLKPDEVNILCSDTTENRNKLKKKLGVKYKIGEVPLRGQSHKMFTFCTRTVYLGADFYSTNARTFILSDANIDSLAVDISLDLPQILGRQRLIENPWKNHAEFYFKNLGGGKDVSKKVFEEFLNSKMSKTDNLLGIYNDLTDQGRKDDLADKYKRDIFSSNYRFDYVSINQVYGQSSVPVFNKLVHIAEQRAFEIQQTDYKDRFSVFSTLKSKSGARLDKISEFVDKLRNNKSIPLNDRLKELCETEDFTEEEKKVIAQQTSEKFDKFYNLLGPKRCKALGYKTSDIAREILIMTCKDTLVIEFRREFEIGKRYSNVETKEKVRDIYIRLGLSKNPKGTDVLEYFNVKKVIMSSPLDKTKKINGIEILAIK